MCQSNFCVTEWHLFEWGTAQSMAKYGSPAQMLPSHLNLHDTWCFQPSHGPQHLCRTSMKYLPKAFPLPFLPALLSSHAWFAGCRAEREWSFLSSLTQMTYILICVNLLNYKSLEVMLYIGFLFLQSWSSHQHTHRILFHLKLQPPTSKCLSGRQNTKIVSKWVPKHMP